MKKTQFKIEINAPPSKVYDKMLGISDKDTYNQWVSAFNPSSRYEGSWEQGSNISFIGTDEEGKPGGMLCIVTKNIPNEYISIQTLGLIANGVEVTSGSEVAQWQNLEESYHFEELDGTTKLTVEVEIPDDYVEVFSSLWPKALEKLKSIIE